MPISNQRIFQYQTMPFSILWDIRPNFSGLSPCWRQVAYALRTRAPVAVNSIATVTLPLDLHVLGLPLAFILSQDQTLHCKSLFFIFISCLMLKEIINFSCLNFLKEHIPYFIFADKKSNRTPPHHLHFPTHFRSSNRFRSNCGCKGRNYFLIYQTF